MIENTGGLMELIVSCCDPRLIPEEYGIFSREGKSDAELHLLPI